MMNMLQEDLHTTTEREWDGYILLQVQLHASLHYVSLLYYINTSYDCFFLLLDLHKSTKLRKNW